MGDLRDLVDLPNDELVATLIKSSGLNEKSSKEPLWTDAEMAKFWDVLDPYISRLIAGQAPLPSHDLDLEVKDDQSSNHLDLAILDVQELMWTGKYSQAVAALRATVAYFKNCKSEKYDLSNKEAELKTLKTIFMKRLPSRWVWPSIRWGNWTRRSDLKNVFTLILLEANLIIKMMQKPKGITETLAHGYSSERAQREISNAYQHDRV